MVCQMSVLLFLRWCGYGKVKWLVLQRFNRGGHRQNDIQQLVHTLIEDVLTEFSISDRLDQLQIGVAASGGHFLWEPVRIPSTWSLEAPQSETTKPAKVER